MFDWRGGMANQLSDASGYIRDIYLRNNSCHSAAQRLVTSLTPSMTRQTQRNACKWPERGCLRFSAIYFANCIYNDMKLALRVKARTAAHHSAYNSQPWSSVIWNPLLIEINLFRIKREKVCAVCSYLLFKLDNEIMTSVVRKTITLHNELLY